MAPASLAQMWWRKLLAVGIGGAKISGVPVFLVVGAVGSGVGQITLSRRVIAMFLWLFLGNTKNGAS